MIEKVNIKIENYISELQNEKVFSLYKNISSGKQLRAKLLYYIAGENELSINTASIIEMIHLASLLHDDVIDNSFLRRNKKSINAIFGDKSAIMLGDILYSKAFYELLNLNSEISKIISKAVINLSIGELEDLELSKEFNLDKNKYLNMIYLKTSSLIEATVESAAILSGKPRDLYKNYGKNIGLAFQIVDDILDTFMDNSKIGKPTFNDFKEGKFTLPYIYLYELLEDKDRQILISLYKKELTEDNKIWILESMKKYRVIKKTLLFAEELIEKAISFIEGRDEKKLIEIAENMLNREF